MRMYLHTYQPLARTRARAHTHTYTHTQEDMDLYILDVYIDT
jgi:hypothetical protein